jgi:hypothetical protein
MKFTPSQQGFQQQEMIRSILSVEKWGRKFLFASRLCGWDWLIWSFR